MSQSITYKIRHGQPSEADYLTALVMRSQGSWGYPDAWMDLWRERLTITSEMMEGMVTLIAEDQGVIKGFWCRTPEWSVEKPTRGFFFVEPDAIRQGCGRQLFQAMKVELLKRHVDAFSIIVEPKAVPFYLKMGGMKISEIESNVPIRMLPVIHFDLTK